MKVPITGNPDLDAVTVRAVLKLHSAAMRAQAAAGAAADQARQRARQLRQRGKRLRWRLAESRPGRWLRERWS